MMWSSLAAGIQAAVFAPSMRRLLFLAFGAAILTLNSCHLFDTEEPIPAYLHIKAFDVKVKNDGSQGSASHQIGQAWVYVDRQLVGVFETPVTVPVLKTGDQEVIVYAGVRKNGRFEDRIPYPFFEGYVDTINLVAAEIDTVAPVAVYKESVEFAWLEDFEDRSISLESSGTNITIDSIGLTSEPTDVFEYDGFGNKVSAVIDMGEGAQAFESSSISRFDFPRGVDLFMEMNYKTDVPLQVGLYPLNSSTVLGIPVLLLFPTDGEWKKVYISLGEDVNSAEFSGTDFKIFFNALSNGDPANQKIFLDNIKVLHF